STHPARSRLGLPHKVKQRQHVARAELVLEDGRTDGHAVIQLERHVPLLPAQVLVSATVTFSMWAPLTESKSSPRASSSTDCRPCPTTWTASRTDHRQSPFGSLRSALRHPSWVDAQAVARLKGCA